MWETISRTTFWIFILHLQADKAVCACSHRSLKVLNNVLGKTEFCLLFLNKITKLLYVWCNSSVSAPSFSCSFPYCLPHILSVYEGRYEVVFQITINTFHKCTSSIQLNVCLSVFSLQMILLHFLLTRVKHFSSFTCKYVKCKAYIWIFSIGNSYISLRTHWFWGSTVFVVLGAVLQESTFRKLFPRG